MDNLRAAFRKLTDSNFESFTIATVTSLDSGGETFDAEDLVNEVPIYNVRLQAVSDGSKKGVLLSPKVGSFVIVAALSKDFKDSFCVMLSEIEKVSVQIGNTSITIDKDGVIANEGKNGGLCIVPELKAQLAKQTARIDALFSALKNSATGANDGGLVYQSNIRIALDKVADKENFENIENPKIKH